IDIPVALARAPARRGRVAPGLIADVAVLDSPPNRQILLAALTAEGERQQDLAARTGLNALVVTRQVTCLLVLERDIDGVTLRQELVQPKGEKRTVGDGLPCLR